MSAYQTAKADLTYPQNLKSLPPVTHHMKSASVNSCLNFFNFLVLVTVRNCDQTHIAEIYWDIQQNWRWESDSLLQSGVLEARKFLLCAVIVKAHWSNTQKEWGLSVLSVVVVLQCFVHHFFVCRSLLAGIHWGIQYLISSGFVNLSASEHFSIIQIIISCC